MTTTKKNITIIHYAEKLLTDNDASGFLFLIISLQYQGKMVKIESILSYSVFKYIWPYRRLDLIQN